jgi:hypothetical protein
VGWGLRDQDVQAWLRVRLRVRLRAWVRGVEGRKELAAQVRQLRPQQGNLTAVWKRQRRGLAWHHRDAVLGRRRSIAAEQLLQARKDLSQHLLKSSISIRSLGFLLLLLELLELLELLDLLELLELLELLDLLQQRAQELQRLPVLILPWRRHDHVEAAPALLPLLVQALQGFLLGKPMTVDGVTAMLRGYAARKMA